MKRLLIRSIVALLSLAFIYSSHAQDSKKPTRPVYRVDVITVEEYNQTFRGYLVETRDSQIVFNKSLMFENRANSTPFDISGIGELKFYEQGFSKGAGAAIGIVIGGIIGGIAGAQYECKDLECVFGGFLVPFAAACAGAGIGGLIGGLASPSRDRVSIPLNGSYTKYKEKRLEIERMCLKYQALRNNP